MGCPNRGTSHEKDMPTTQMGTSGTGGQHGWRDLKLEQRDRKAKTESNGDDRNKKHGITDHRYHKEIHQADVRINKGANSKQNPRRKNGKVEIFEYLMANDFSNIMKDIKLQTQAV